MPWYIVKPDGRKVEAFRTRTEASHYLPDYTEGHRIEFYPSTKLQAVRTAAGMSQRGLSVRTEIPLGTIQKWEQGSKDINRAAVEDVLRLTKALGCEIEDILE